MRPKMPFLLSINSLKSASLKTIMYSWKNTTRSAKESSFTDSLNLSKMYLYTSFGVIDGNFVSVSYVSFFKNQSCKPMRCQNVFFDFMYAALTINLEELWV